MPSILTSGTSGNGLQFTSAADGALTIKTSAADGSAVVDAITLATSGAVTLAAALAGTTVAASGSIALGGATVSAGGGSGINFPATQSASTNANTLDDYEEGTWTPNQGSGLTLVGGFSSSGVYVKIGKVVTVAFEVTGATTVASSSGGIICTNLPFANVTANVLTPGSMTNWNADSGGACAVPGSTSTTVYGVSAIAATYRLSCALVYNIS